MLNKIKSSFMLKEVASYIDEKIKLDLFKYNKTIQNKLDINIINYKEFGGKYKIGDKNGKGKEYNGHYDTLIFEGEYLNGRRNGKGKEYHYFRGRLEFEGEYLNGKRNGNGIEYYWDCKKKFEGEYKNGNMWTGKLYDYENNIIYEIKNGKGIYKGFNDDNRLIFEGEHLNGERNGKGKEFK